MEPQPAGASWVQRQSNKTSAQGIVRAFRNAARPANGYR
jgi:hypothetical protein